MTQHITDPERCPRSPCDIPGRLSVSVGEEGGPFDEMGTVGFLESMINIPCVNHLALQGDRGVTCLRHEAVAVMMLGVMTVTTADVS